MDDKYISFPSDYFADRMHDLQNLFIEICCANFDTRIARSEQGGEIEALVTSANMLAEELGYLFRNQDLTAFFPGNDPMSYTSFILDHNFEIWSACPKTAGALSLDPQAITGNPLETLLAKDSQKDWERVKATLEREDNVEDPIELFFILPNGLTRPAYCRVSALCRGRKKMWAVMILAYPPEENPPAEKPKSKNAVSLHYTDVKTLRQIKLHIKQFPEKPLPTLEVMARQYGLNEHKLKHGFKQLFGITIFRLQRQERLKKALPLVEYTQKPLKAIAYSIGYSLSNFYEAFKEEYGCTPGDFRKG